MLVVPDLVRAKAVAAGAEGWLVGLPDLVAALAEEWGLVVGDPFADGTEAYVAAATLVDGTPGVLKVCVPRPLDAGRREIAVYRLAGGDGCATLLRHDVDREALLLERLGPPMASLGLPLEERLSALVDAAAQVWRPAPDADLPSGAAKARDLAAFVATTWDEVGRPCSAAVVDHALACAAAREAAHDDDRAVLCHGDVHQWNALRSADGWRLVDPDGLVAEPELDLGVILREDPDTPEVLRDRCAGLARRTGLDPAAIWEWGVVERVATGLVCEQIGLQPVGRQMLAAAEALTATGWWR